MRPEDMWLLEDEYAEAYHEKCAAGREVAGRAKVAIVGIARTAMPHLANTLGLIDDTADLFGSAVAYFYENDSTDETPAVLKEWGSKRRGVVVESEAIGAAEGRGFEPDRTVRLARCRNRCKAWVAANAADSDYVLVLDLDPHGGFSPDGILNSVGWFADLDSKSTISLSAGAMASYSLICMPSEEEDKMHIAHYDAWAARLTVWEDRRDHMGGMAWLHAWMPPVGSPPLPMLSAFGGACLYRTAAYLSGTYDGIGVRGKPDCEHVQFHRSMRQAGWQLYLNPGSRYVAVLPASQAATATYRAAEE